MKGHEEVRDFNCSSFEGAKKIASPGKPCTGYTLWGKSKAKVRITIMAEANLK